MKNTILKPFVLPTIYILAVVLIIVGVYYSSLSLINSEVMDVGYLEYVNNSIINNTIPVIKTDVSIYKPYIDDNIIVSKQFYDREGLEEDQINAILNFDDRYIQNEGIIYSSPQQFEVYSIMSGTVANVTTDEDLGIIVEIKHSNNLTSFYQSLGTTVVAINDIITQGQKIGTSGTNHMKDKSENQLHFELHYLNNAVNPEQYYNKKISEL